MPTLSEAADQVPLCTLSIATLCIVLQVYVTLFDVPISNFTVVAVNVIYLGEYYRIISAALLHGSLMHIAFNMMSFLSIGANLERSIGTLALFFTVMWSIILGGVIYVGAEWAMTMWVTNDPGYANQQAIGFSGVIFTLALMESYRSTQPTRLLFGMVQVPTRVYPWVLLIVLSVVIPGISFMGHLAGILVGVLHVYGVTKPLLPSTAHYAEMESYEWLRHNIGQRRNFVACPLALPTTGAEPLPSSASLRQSCGSLYASIGTARRSLHAFASNTAAGVRGWRNGEAGAGARDTPAGEVEASGRLLNPRT